MPRPTSRWAPTTPRSSTRWARSSGGLTYGAKKEAGEEHFRKALKLAPDSPIAHIEFANGLVMMHGKKALEEAAALYAKAAALEPRDAMEKLDVEAAKAELE